MTHAVLRALGCSGAQGGVCCTAQRTGPMAHTATAQSVPQAMHMAPEAHRNAAHTPPRLSPPPRTSHHTSVMHLHRATRRTTAWPCAAQPPPRAPLRLVIEKSALEGLGVACDAYTLFAPRDASS